MFILLSLGDYYAVFGDFNFYNSFNDFGDNVYFRFKILLHTYLRVLILSCYLLWINEDYFVKNEKLF
jgi:hypothetical protein